VNSTSIYVLGGFNEDMESLDSVESYDVVGDQHLDNGRKAAACYGWCSVCRLQDLCLCVR